MDIAWSTGSREKVEGEHGVRTTKQEKLTENALTASKMNNFGVQGQFVVEQRQVTKEIRRHYPPDAFGSISVHDRAPIPKVTMLLLVFAFLDLKRMLLAGHFNVKK